MAPNDENLSTQKLLLEMQKLEVEIEKIMAETEKIDRERSYYPVVVGGGITLAVVGVIKLFL